MAVSSTLPKCETLRSWSHAAAGDDHNARLFSLPAALRGVWRDAVTDDCCDACVLRCVDVVTWRLRLRMTSCGCCYCCCGWPWSAAARRDAFSLLAVRCRQRWHDMSPI